MSSSKKSGGKSSSKVSFGSSLVSCLSPTDHLNCFAGFPAHGTRGGGAITSDLAVADSELSSLHKSVVQCESNAADLEHDIKSVVGEVEQLLVHLSDAEDATYLSKSIFNSLSTSSAPLDKLSAKVTKGSPALANAMTKEVATARDAVEALVFTCEKEVSRLGRLIEAKNNVKAELEQQLANVKMEISILKASISQSKAALERFYAATQELKAMSLHVASLHSARFDPDPDSARSTSSRAISGAPPLSARNLLASSPMVPPLSSMRKDDDAASVASSHRSTRVGGKGSKRPKSSSGHHHHSHSHSHQEGQSQSHSHSRHTAKKHERSDFAAV